MLIVQSFCGLALLLIIGQWLRTHVSIIKKLYLPASVVGGLLGLVLIQTLPSEWTASWTAGWSQLPGFLINIVFATLFLGVRPPSLKNLWGKAGPQLAYGQIVAWGQYAVGLGLVLLLLKPLFSISAEFGVIIEVGFEGGHGTAAGLRQTFNSIGFPQGADIGLTAATIGMISAIIVGFAFINWGARNGHLANREDLVSTSYKGESGFYREKNHPAGYQTTQPETVDSLAFHLAMIGIAIWFGVLIRDALIFIQSFIPALASSNLLSGFPLFPLCMLGGLALQSLLGKKRAHYIDHGLMQRWGGGALDILVLSAISTIHLDAVLNDAVPFIILMIAGISWNIFCLGFLAKRLLPGAWLERGVAELGQSMGVTATGLLLLRAADPQQKTEAMEAFGSKQLFHEPFMGGGLWTSTAVILTAHKGGWFVFGISISAIAIWLAVWYGLWRPGKRSH